MSERLTIVLTGASGVVGRAIAPELRRHRLVGLVHREQFAPDVDATLVCDLTLPRLGLSNRAWRDLAEEADMIVHSGALATWGQPAERYRQVNIDGTRRVLELAETGAVPVQLISTCFVAAIERGMLGELGEENVVRPYIESKLAAERLFRDSGVLCNVFRPPNLIGDSRTGASSRPQIIQTLSNWICRGRAPYIPLHAGNLIDLVPLDVLARAVAGAVDEHEFGQLYWVTYGDQALTIEQTLAIVADHARRLGRDLAGVQVLDPREGLPSLESVPAPARPYLKVMNDVSEVTYAAGGVLPSSISQLHERFGVTPIFDMDWYRLSLDYWAREAAA
jgi:nucleoside-diphosphate-sugar epimerase